MALSEFEIKRAEKLVGNYIKRIRPTPDVRKDLDVGFRVAGQSIEIFNIRPAFADPKQTIEEPIAKTTYVKTHGHWKVLWQRSDMKWHSYPPKPTVRHLEEFLQQVDSDPHGCFWG